MDAQLKGSSVHSGVEIRPNTPLDTTTIYQRLLLLHLATMEYALKVSDALKSFRVCLYTLILKRPILAHCIVQETRLSGLRPPNEFFDVQRISRPADMNTATSRISYNTRYFSGTVFARRFHTRAHCAAHRQLSVNHYCIGNLCHVRNITAVLQPFNC